jgi:hypothetical protein
VTTNELLAHRLAELESDVEVLARRTDRLLWALVTLSLSLAGSAVVFALTVASVRT